MLVVFENLSLLEFQIRYFALFCLFWVIDGFECSGWEVSGRILYSGVPIGFIIGLRLYLPNISDLPDDVICSLASHADDTALYSKCDLASDLCQQLELASETESDLRETLDWGRKWLVDFNAGKTKLALFDRSNDSDAIDVKMYGPVLE